jgi:hypothetical protein
MEIDKDLRTDWHHAILKALPEYTNVVCYTKLATLVGRRLAGVADGCVMDYHFPAAFGLPLLR